MRKLITTLAVIIAPLAVSFSQNTIVDGSHTATFYLDGSATGFSVAWNENAKTVLIAYDVPLTVNIPTSELGLVFGTILSITHKSMGTNGNYASVISYNDYDIGIVNGGIGMNSTSITLPEYYEEDTLTAFNNGVASVTCDYVEQDTIDAYNNGINSGYANGFDAGVASVTCDFVEQDTIDAYNNGLAAGADLTVNAVDYQAGFEAGKLTCSGTGIAMPATEMGVSVSPNPVSIGSSITVTCPNFDKAVVLSITGQIVDTYSTQNVPTSGLNTGVYFMNVHDTNGNVSATKVLVIE